MDDPEVVTVLSRWLFIETGRQDDYGKWHSLYDHLKIYTIILLWYVGSLPWAEQRQANLTLWPLRANAYEKTGFKDFPVLLVAIDEAAHENEPDCCA